MLSPFHLHAGVQCGGKVMGWGQGQRREDFRASKNQVTHAKVQRMKARG